MTKTESRDKVLIKSEIIYKYLSNTIGNPSDKGPADARAKLVNDIYFNDGQVRDNR